MATFDVRDKTGGVVDAIIFGSQRGGFEDYAQGFSIRKSVDSREGVQINDAEGEFILISTKQHALDLIKALEKVIELNWLT